MGKPALQLVVDNLAEDPTAAVAPGDVVRTGDHAHPRYQVIATSDERAWVRDVQDGTDYVVPLSRCRKI